MIKENHKKRLKANESDLAIVNPSLQTYMEGDFKFFTYCYNEPKSQNYWQLFLPKELVDKQSFEITEFSFVLFAEYESMLYCTVGGSGFNVIKSYIDTNFGIDLYQHFAKPSEDVLLNVSTRGVAGNISQKTHPFNFNQRISESLEYSEIPKKIKILVRDELKKGIFKNYDLDSDKAILEVGSYFNLRKKLNFEEFKQLIIDINSIRQDKSNYVQLTLFAKISELDLLKTLDKYLQNKVADDVTLHNQPNQLHKLNEDIIELVNPKKLEKFYECNEYKIRFKNTNSNNDVIISDKKDLYKICTKIIYEKTRTISDRFEIVGLFYKLNIIGLIDGKETTFGNLYSHITSEITYKNKKYFRVDEKWYYLDDKFLEQINKDAKNTYLQNKLESDLLRRWEPEWDEDKYNKSHVGPNYFVLDKITVDNIELCDIMHIEGNKISLIHVKNSFNTQMRNLYIQVILSAKRLWNDLYNNMGKSYFKRTLKEFTKKNRGLKLNHKILFEKIIEDQMQIEFVMAYNNTAYKNSSSVKKIEKSQSNIAKYSLIQTVREMRSYRRFGIKVIDISEI